MSNSRFKDRDLQNWRNCDDGRTTKSIHFRTTSSTSTNQDGRVSGSDRNRMHNNRRNWSLSGRDQERRYQHENEDNGSERSSSSGFHHKNNDKSAKKCYMGFRYVQNLIESRNIENILVTLNNDRKGFKELLDSGNLSNDLVVLIIKLLSEVCASNFTESKIRLLEMTFNSELVDNLIKFISTIAIQNTKEKKNSKYFWNDTDEFWNNTMNLCQNVHDLIRLTSCEKTLKILKAMKLYIPVIENNHLIHISGEIKEKIDNLCDVVENTFEELEKKHTQVKSIKAPIELEPPDNFRNISVYPTVEEITSLESPFLRPNVVTGPYQNVNHYLDVQFRLLREDFVAPLRKGVCSYLKNTKDRLEDIRIYNPIRFLKIETVNEQNCYRIQYDFSGKKKTFQYENSRRFLFGSLLCFTSNNFNSVIFGKIVQRDIKDLEQGHLIIGFNEDINLPKNLFGENYLMVESKVFFEPYYQVLNVLKTMQTDNFPMEKYIIRVETDTTAPDYLLNINPVFYEIEKHTFWPLNWSDRKFYGLNDSQHDAFKAALTNEFSIIQGPPGTGKTFLGLKIAHTLINNKSCWYKKTPMLVICFTNHALDQFLEGLLEVTDNIIRVGGQSRNENLTKYNIRNYRHMNNATVIQMWHQVRSHLQNISTINETLKQIELNESIVEFSVFSEVIAEYDGSWFSSATKEDVLNWLFGSRQHAEPVNRHRNINVTQGEENINLDIGDNDEEEDFDIEEGEIRDDIFENITSISFRPLISVRELFTKMQTLDNELNILQADKSSDRLRRMFIEEDIIYELDVLQRNCKYLQHRLSEAANGLFRGKLDYIDLQNPNVMPPKLRWHLYFYWLNQYKIKLLEKKEKINREFRKDYKLYSEMRDIQDTQIMKDALVVGMTTTAAARLKSSLQALKSPIVIVEEAAEVLEAHIVCSLTNCCKHLILIGDHQQLKPSTANFTIETKYLLGISLFERMVKNNIQCHTLNIQHRMRPEIASLIRPAIYSVLEDHESVLNRAPIRGIENCIYFIDHQESEQLCKDSSKKNIHEAEFLIRLAKHLVLNGYKPENITILAAYLGQMFEMLRQRKQHSLLKDVKIVVLDNYQGEENDIVLLSLVRSNNENKIGFLKIENRVCVALSRAKHGLYIMGNMSQLCTSSSIWIQIKESLNNLNAVGPYLTLRCQVHRNKLTQVKTAEDFMDIPEGGCNLMCETGLGCGHTCKSLCHVEDRDHISYKCYEKCIKVLCSNEEHICQKLCYQECGPCTYPVQHVLDCGHQVTIECHIDPTNYNCHVPVKSVLPCGHEVDKPCFRDPEYYECPEPCAIRVEPCGHACTRSCHIREDPDHLQYRCKKPCVRPKIGCSLPDDEKHICSKFCFEECDNCDIGVKKFRTVCSHVYVIACRLNVDEIECKKPCTRLLPCGHKCGNSCNQPCGNCKQKVEKYIADCNHKVKVKCSEEPDRKFCKGKCSRLLPCGHVCDKKCCEKCVTSCKAIVDCLIPSPCGHIVKTISCVLKNSVDPEILLQHCKEKCNVKLKCGHFCSGGCGDCSQGRIHQRCKEKCGSILICNHECPVPCSQACKPCQKNCNYKCRHNKCNRKCGDPCNECKELCKRKCEHQSCPKRCGQVCSVPPCYEDCKKLLKCGHPCVGFCGDPCPILCKVCDRDKLTEIFLGNEDEEDARYVMLEDCKHIFESGDIEHWLQLSDEIMIKFCPRCKTPITSTERFSEYSKRTMIDITNVKNKSNGTIEENNLRRIEFLFEVDNIKLAAGELYESSDLRRAIDSLNGRLQISKKKGGKLQRQTVNKIDLDVVRAKLQLINFVVDVCGKQENNLMSDPAIQIQISFIVNALMRDENHITEQEIDDISLEIERLSRIIQYNKIQNTENFNYVKNKKEVKDKIECIENLLTSPKRYSAEIDAVLQTELTDLNKLVASSQHITAIERQQIVAAIGLKKGHWFKCPNGHYYVIGDCGGANQISRCNECGEQIGGQRHQLLPGQRHAPEMDNSLHPAWSEAANMANYRL